MRNVNYLLLKHKIAMLGEHRLHSMHAGFAPQWHKRRAIDSDCFVWHIVTNDEIVYRYGRGYAGGICQQFVKSV